METIRRTLLLVGLCCAVTGCTATHLVLLPCEAPAPPQDSILVRTARVGMRARVTLWTGETVEGEIMDVEEDSLTLGKVGNYGLEETVIPAADIAFIEINEPTETANFIAAVLVTSGTTLILLAAIAAASLDASFN